MRNRCSKGFTLIEMSVVLVIIGLLVSGIVVGRTLIRSSQLQSIITDVNTYQSAMSQFKEKYGFPPGDFPTATTIWGTNPNCSTGGAGTGTQTCNGAGNGQITFNGGSTGPYEPFLAWQHLASAGFIPGSYSGAIYPGVASHYGYYCYPNVNCPGGKVSEFQAYYAIYSVNAFAGGNTSSYWDAPAGNYLLIGQTKRNGTPGFPGNAMVAAPEAYMLDSKADDGLPGTGLWRSFTATGNDGNNFGNNCVVVSGTSTPVTDGTIASQATAAYNIAYGNLAACAFLVQLNF